MKFQSQVIRKYENDGWYVINLIKTNKNGIPDLLCLKGDDVLFIECKEGNDYIKVLQKFRMDELRKIGVKAVCLHKEKGIIYGED